MFHDDDITITGALKVNRGRAGEGETCLLDWPEGGHEAQHR